MSHLADLLRGLGCETTPGTDALEVMNGAEDGRWFSLATGDSWLIGRAEEAQVPLLLDVSVSRQHARLSRAAGRYYVEDLGSTHGTVRNGQSVAGEIELRYGDQLLLGSTLLELRRGGEQSPEGDQGNSEQP